METRKDNWLYWRARAGLAEEDRDRLRVAAERVLVVHAEFPALAAADEREAEAALTEAIHALERALRPERSEP